MKRLILLSALAFIGVGVAHSTTGRADNPPTLPTCATNGDADGDGVTDDLDSAVTDSCTSTHSGFEDCSTGAGDGIPDCH